MKNRNEIALRARINILAYTLLLFNAARSIRSDASAHKTGDTGPFKRCSGGSARPQCHGAYRDSRSIMGYTQHCAVHRGEAQTAAHCGAGFRESVSFLPCKQKTCLLHIFGCTDLPHLTLPTGRLWEKLPPSFCHWFVPIPHLTLQRFEIINGSIRDDATQAMLIAETHCAHPHAIRVDHLL